MKNIYKYSNNSGSFNVTDRSGNNIRGVKNSFNEFVKSNNPKSTDTVLYRTFWKNPLAFWRWHTYFNDNDERYDLPYKNFFFVKVVWNVRLCKSYNLLI